jgi:glycosyltransferase involved in cell wall biosynthesis
VEHDIRILGLSEGDARTAMSGVAGRLFDALDQRFDVVDRLDYSTAGAERMALAALTFRPSRSVWRARFHTALRAQQTLSDRLARRIEAGVAEHDVAFQVHGWVSRQPRPYVVYLDQTRLMAERGWPSWLPITRRERSQILRQELEMYRQAAHLFTMGQPARQSLEDEYGIDPSSVSVVGGGLMLEEIPPQAELTTDPAVLFVGRESERKGLPRLLQAFAVVRREMPAATLRIVGPRRRFRQPGVINHGRLDRRRLAALYSSSRVLCMPSQYEPWGFVFAEAMAHGVPCVGSTVQSIPEILDHGNAGVLAHRDDVEALARALLQLLRDDALARRIGLAGRRRVQQLYTWDRVAERIAPDLVAIARTTT